MKFQTFVGLFCAIGTAVFFPARTSLAETFAQTLDPKQSRFHFELEGDVLNLSGKFNSYSGTVTYDRKSLSPTQVVLKVDLSDVTLARTDSLGSLNAFSPEAVFRALPDPVVTFLSKTVVPLSQNKYRVQGIIRRGAKEWNSHFDVSVGVQSALRSEVALNISGPAFQFATQLPFHLGGANDQGSIDAHFVFVTR